MSKEESRRNFVNIVLLIIFLILLALSFRAYPQLSWNVTVTDKSHTIKIYEDLMETPVLIGIGDTLGVFYRNDAGYFQCGGKGAWLGDSLVMAAYGDDTGLGSTPEKDGFDEGEEFWFWVKIGNARYPIYVTSWLQFQGFPVVPNEGAYYTDAISCPDRIEFCIEQDIQINQGWNMISSYLWLYHDTFPDIMSSDSIILVKNEQGMVYFPTFGIDEIGNWHYHEAYKLKSTHDFTLKLPCKGRVGPIADVLSAGWQLIPVLRVLPLRIEKLLLNQIPSIIIVKNQQGWAWIPALGINTIVFAEPGQGYSIKMSNTENYLH